MMPTRATTLALFASFALGAPVLAGDDNSPPFDFSDAFYVANGVDPALIEGRVTGNDPISVIDDSPDPEKFADVRVLLTIPAYDHSGDLVYFTVFGELFAESFTDNAAGEEARAIGDEYPIYIFPREGNPSGEIFPKRQEDVVPLNNGYFSNDPLGLWRFVFVTYTDAAFNTPDGQAALAELAEENGVTLDGTPVITTENDILDLAEDGFVDLHLRPDDGSEGEPWSICPVIEDPRDAGIQPDAFLAFVAQDNGAPLPASQVFVDEFNCLQQTGDFCEGVGGCAADYNGDGLANVLDFIDVQEDFASGDDKADVNDDDVLNILDFVAFQTAFEAGCP